MMRSRDVPFQMALLLSQPTLVSHIVLTSYLLSLVCLGSAQVHGIQCLGSAQVHGIQ